MKKVLGFLILVLIVVTLSVASCGAKAETTSNADSTVVDSISMVDTIPLSLDSIEPIQLKK